MLSDTHNEKENTRAALAVFRARGVDQLIHCGDLTRPKMVQLFQGWQAAFVFGNLDHDRPALSHAVARTPGPHHMGLIFHTILNDTRIGVCHGHDELVLQAMIGSGAYDLVCHGHWHQRRNEKIGQTWVVNPGALGGRASESRSACIIDLGQHAIEFIYV